MTALNLPLFTPKVLQRNGKYLIFDPVRKKHVALTPEEQVRRQFVNYLITDRSYPLNLVANEVTITLNGRLRRCDTVIYNVYLEPLAIVEYKAPSAPIVQDVFDQIVRYNLSLRVRYLMISNGLEHYCCRMDYINNKYDYLDEIPDYSDLSK